MNMLRRIAAVAALSVVASVPAFAQAKDWRKIQYPKLPAFEIPAPEVYMLDNGMQIFLMEDHELPLIGASVRFRMGSNHEPADKVGLGDVYAQVLREGGTTTRPGDEIDEWLGSRAANVEMSMSGDVAFASLDSLKEDFPDVLRLFRDLLASPAFPEDKINLAKNQEKTGIARRNDDIGGIVAREFGKLVRGADSPLARTTEYATLAAIGRDDLVAWHERYVHPNNMMLGIVGDFDPAAMKALIQDVFGGWKRGPDADLGEVPYREEPLPGMYFVEKGDVTQANIRLGHLGIRQDDPDYFAVQILNEVMSGGFTSRLFGTIRTEMGLAYNVFGSVGSSFLRPGVFAAGTQTKSEQVSVALAAMEDVIAGMIANPPTDDEIARAKDSILQSFVFNYASRDQILGQQMEYAYYGLPSDYLDRYRANIEKVTRDQVAQAAKKHLHPDRFTVLVVGKSADFDRPLAEIGEFTAIDIAIPPPPDTGPSAVRSAANLDKGRAAFGRTVALLGRGNPSGLTGYRASMAMTLKMQGQAIPVKQDVLTVFPDRQRSDLNIMGQSQVLVIDGDGGFMAAMGQSRDLPAEMVARQKESMNRDLWFLVRNHDADGLEAVYIEPSSVGGKACDLVEVSLDGTGSTLCIDPDGRVLEESHQGNNPLTQAAGRITNRFSDFQDANGVPVARSVVSLFEGEEFMSGTIESFELDPTPAADAFARP